MKTFLKVLFLLAAAVAIPACDADNGDHDGHRHDPDGQSPGTPHHHR